MATAGQISAIVSEVQAGANIILTSLEAADPALTLPVNEAASITNLVADLVSKAVTAWGAASGTPITVASVQALLPNSIPLTAPTS